MRLLFTNKITFFSFKATGDLTLRSFILAFAILLFFVSGLAAQAGWRTLNSQTGGDLVTVYFTSAARGWVAGDRGYIASTDDGGRKWNRVNLDIQDDINEIYFRNEENGYLVAGRKVFITNDSGVTWRETVLFRTGEFRNGTPEFFSIRFADRRRGLVVGSVLNSKNEVVDSLVMKTEDGGETWQRVVVPSKTELFHLDYSGSSLGWIVGDQGVILATTDGGSSWQMQQSGTINVLYNVDFRDEDEGFAVGEKGII
ncbi:MAG: hypothetical protein LC734_04470, partial [Acidobacteria bacterium]|nr:hypothetical protein [Acidobacteriota bacterium]